MRSKASVLALFGFLSASSALSASFPLDEGFYPASSLSASQLPANFARAQQASVRLQTLGVSSCSASMISSDGYAITAAHCITTCLIDNKVATQVENADPEFDFTRVDNQQPKIHCPSLVIQELGGLDPSVVFVGRGFNGFDDRKVMSFSEDTIRQLGDVYNDFAILKFDLGKPVACIPALLDAHPAPGSRIWAVGFPGANSGRHGHFSDGRSEYVSYGHVTRGVRDNAFFQEYFANQPEAIVRLGRLYGVEGSVMSNMDIYPGDSGSMALDDQGRLIGVNTSMAIPDSNMVESRFYDGSAVTLSLSAVTAELRRHQLSPEQISRFFDCREK